MKAYKGFKKDFTCRGEKFEVGGTYTRELHPSRSKLELCSKDGWHYCSQLEQVFQHYSHSSSNIFCEIDITGEFTEDSNKGITNGFTIVRMLEPDDIDKILKEQENERNNEEAKLLLKAYNIIQDKYPVNLGGSLALWLYGCRLQRDWEESDLDLQIPYYVKFRSKELVGNYIDKFDPVNIKNSGNDFDYGFSISTEDREFIKVDLAIRPSQRYNIIEKEGVEYRVALLEDIIEAKLRYAIKGNEKHKNDLYDMLGVDTKSIEF